MTCAKTNLPEYIRSPRDGVPRRVANPPLQLQVGDRPSCAQVLLDHCPGDENLSGYRHVVLAVGSNSALSDLLNTYDQYSASLRSGARRSILVVTDDDSALGAGDFTSQLQLRPGFDDFRFHAAALATEPIPPVPPPGLCWRGGQAGTQGAVYLDLTAQLGGYFHDFCLSEDLDPSWDPLSLTIAIFVDSFDSGSTEDWSAVAP